MVNAGRRPPGAYPETPMMTLRENESWAPESPNLLPRPCRRWPHGRLALAALEAAVPGPELAAACGELLAALRGGSAVQAPLALKLGRAYFVARGTYPMLRNSPSRPWAGLPGPVLGQF